MRMYLLEEWNNYATFLVPNAPKNQLVDMRRAFMSGAAAFYKIQMCSLSSGDKITEDDMQIMRSLDRELQSFYKDVKEGRA
jgi:hypothetical protein